MGLQNILGGLMLAAVRKDTEGALNNNGEETRLQVNEDGRLKVVAKPGSFDLCKGSLTLNTAVATGVTGNGAVAGTGFFSVDVSAASNIMLHFRNAGTAAVTNGTVIFEGSLDSTNGTDGTWFPVQGIASNSNTILTSANIGTLAVGAGATYGIELSINGCNWFRVRVTSNITPNATGVVQFSVQRASYATEPIPAAQITGTQPISGTVTAVTATPTTLAVSSAASTNATAVKGSAGSTLYAISATNTGASTVHLKLYNKATAPTVGTDVPVMTIPITPNSIYIQELGAVGMRFTVGIGSALTGGIADNDTTAVAAGQVKLMLSYI